MPNDESLYVGGSEYAGTQQIIKEFDLEIIDYTPYVDWQQVRIQAAIAAMQGFCANKICLEKCTYDERVNLSVRQADALIEELKKTM